MLPRWFVLTALATVPLAAAAVIAAFVVSGPDEVPVAERRPPPSATLTSDVGDYVIGESQPVPLDPPCPALEGLRVAGTQADRAILATGLSALCGTDASELVRQFAAAGGVVRFAQFAETGVDSAARLDEPTVLVNARFSVTDPTWIAPLVVHDLVTLAGEPGTAETALAARRAEAQLCDELGEATEQSRACRDAAALLAADDPLAALRDAGYRRRR